MVPSVGCPRRRGAALIRGAHDGAVLPTTARWFVLLVLVLVLVVVVVVVIVVVVVAVVVLLLPLLV